MRKAFKLLALVAGIAATAVSCNKEDAAPEVKQPLKLVIRAGAPETKTAISYDGEKTYTPSWSANDAIGVYFTEVSGDATEFVNADAGSTAFFEPSSEITSVSGNQTLYAFYPLGAFNATTSGTSIRVNIKDVQTPNAIGTFDKAADILVARPFAGNISTINEDGGIIDLEFARILSVVKVIPTDATSGGDLYGEYVKSVKIEYNGTTGDDPLTGRVVLDLDSGEFGEWTIKNYGVSATYGDELFALNGTNAAYLLSNPAIIEAGKTVTFTVKTNKHDASKEFVLSNALIFPAGNIAKITLSIDDSWTIEDNTLDPNVIFKTPFYADISSNTTYNEAIHGDLGVVGTSKSTITYSFAGTNQLRNNNNKISDDDGSFYWCTSSTDLVIGGINAGTAQYFTLSFDRKIPSGSATLALTISEDGEHYFPITSTATVSIDGKAASSSSYNFSIPAGEHTSLSLKLDNSGNGAAIDNVTLTKLTAAGENNHEVSFDVVKVDPTLEVSPSPVNLLEGATQQLTVTGTDGTLHFTSNDTGVATVTSEGLVTAVAEGTTTIDITSDASTNYNAGATTVTVNVSASLSFETVIITEDWSADLKNTTGNNAKFIDDGQGVWAVDSNYGRKAANNATAASFYSPKFDMSSVSAGSITFGHTGNVTGTDYQSLGKAYYTLDDGTSWTQITLSNPSSQWNWQTATISSEVYAGKTIQFRWDFQGNSSKTWEVRDFVITVPTHSITVNSEDSPLTVELSGDSSVSTTLTVASGYTWSVKSTTGQPSNYTYSINSNQIIVTPAADNTSGATITGIGTMVLTDGTVDFTINFDQANKTSTPSASWHSESWSSLATNITSYANGNGSVTGDLGSWSYVGIVTSGQTEHSGTFTSKVMSMGSTSDKAKITSPSFANGIQGIKFNYYVNNTARKFKVTVYESDTKVKEVTITPTSANTKLSYEVEGVSTTGSTYFTIESTTSSRRVSIGDVQVYY